MKQVVVKFQKILKVIRNTDLMREPFKEVQIIARTEYVEGGFCLGYEKFLKDYVHND